MATWPAGIEIADARLVPGQPLTQDLMTDYRDRDDLLLEGETLLDLGGSFYDIGLAAARYGLQAGSNGAVGDGITILDQIRIYIPAGVSELKVNIFAACTNTSANHGIRVAVGADNCEWYNLPALGAIAWQAVTAITLTGSGWQDVVVSTRKTGGASHAYYLYGIVIKVSEA